MNLPALLLLVTTAVTQPVPEDFPSLPLAETPSSSARLELIAGQALHGGVQGFLVCGLLRCDAMPHLGVSLLGAGTGALGSWLLSRPGLTPGQAQVINAGSFWGTWFGTLGAMLLALPTDRGIGLMMGSSLGMTGVGLLFAHYGRPLSGQVSMANSGGLWAGILTAAFLGALSPNRSSELFLFAELLATSAGLTSMGLLSVFHPVSRGRMLLIDMGGLVGGLLGFFTPFILGANQLQPVLLSTGVGMAVGLAGATLLTRGVDAPEAPAVTLAPTALPGGAGLSLAGRF
jgi:hypothetical protein